MPESYADHRNAQKYSQVIAILEHPMTAKEIAEKLGISYYTIKPLLNKMVLDDVLKTSAFRRGGAEQFERKQASNMPMFQHFETKEWLNLVTWLDMTLPLREGKGEVFNALRTMPEICWALINLARRVELGASDEGDINVLKTQAVEMYRKAQNVSKFWEQVISSEILWTVAGLRKIAESPDYPDDAELHRYADQFDK